jgi:hypothetical protein
MTGPQLRKFNSRPLLVAVRAHRSAFGFRRLRGLRGQSESFSACSSELVAEVRAMRLRSDRMRQTPSKTPSKSN